MKVRCGTRVPTEMTINIDRYADHKTNGADPESVVKAVELLTSTMDDATFIDDHCRNEDAVNSCIALHVLGYDPEEWFENFFDANNIDNKFFQTDVNRFMEHVERVCKYLEKWGPGGNVANALNYAI